jgi:ketosteroid isomerase-like protein
MNRQNIFYRLEEYEVPRHKSIEQRSKGSDMRATSGHSATETACNKMFTQHIFSELAKGNRKPFADAYSNSAQRFIAEDDHVVVQCRGKVTTKRGEPYHNSYCYVVRLEGGKMRQLDTALAERVLIAPA